VKYGFRMRLYLLLYDLFILDWNYYKTLLGKPRDSERVNRLADKIFGPRIYNVENEEPVAKDDT
jgi:hypothetical protein